MKKIKADWMNYIGTAITCPNCKTDSEVIFNGFFDSTNRFVISQCKLCDYKNYDETLKPVFTWEQQLAACDMIGNWYTYWKDCIADYDNRTHRLGIAKEQLKNMICNLAEVNNDKN